MFHFKIYLHDAIFASVFEMPMICIYICVNVVICDYIKHHKRKNFFSHNFFHHQTNHRNKWCLLFYSVILYNIVIFYFAFNNIWCKWEKPQFFSYFFKCLRKTPKSQWRKELKSINILRWYISFSNVSLNLFMLDDWFGF